MIQKLRNLYDEYPRQYWLMIAGIVIATAGGSMIWPFMLIYASAKLELPLSTVATLISINAGTGLFSSFLAGSIADRVGRKVVMNLSLTMTGVAYFLMSRATTYEHFVLLMILIGVIAVSGRCRCHAGRHDSVGKTMHMPLIALPITQPLRWVPHGGFWHLPHNLAFYGATAGFLTYSILLFFLAPRPSHEASRRPISTIYPQNSGGTKSPCSTDYARGRVFRGFPGSSYMGFIFAQLLAWSLQQWCGYPCGVRKNQLRHPRISLRLDPYHECSDVRLYPVPGHQPHPAIQGASCRCLGDVDLRCRGWQHYAHVIVLGVLAEHGHPDFWRADSCTHGK
jgi:MFS family permease